MQEKILTLIRIISGLAGAILLYREVKIAHLAEEFKQFLLSSNWKWLEEMSTLYQKDFREFYKKFTIHGLTSFNPPLPEATINGLSQNIDQMTDSQIKEKIAEQKMHGEDFHSYFSKLPSKIENYKKISSEGGMKKRKFSLSLGISLIILSAAIDIIDVLIKPA